MDFESDQNWKLINNIINWQLLKHAFRIHFGGKMDKPQHLILLRCEQTAAAFEIPSVTNPPEF